MQLRRVYFVCRSCRVGAYPFEDRLGVFGRRTQAAERLLCLAGASWSYDASAAHLQEFCGLVVSDQQVRSVCHAHGIQMGVWQREEPEVAQTFREAPGEIEFTTDGTSVNTTLGWREMKLAIFSKRDRGAPAEPCDWARRNLPSPNVSVSFAAIEPSVKFGKRWRRWTQRLRIMNSSAVTVLADGARWIWDEQRKQLTYAEGMLDIFHCLQHVAQTGNALFGEGTAASRAWTEQTRESLLAGGYAAICKRIAQIRRETRSPKKRKHLDGLSNYLRPHEHHLDYRFRLAQGRSIGSGQVEGACKQVIGRRLKQTGARWKVRRINRMATLCCLFHSSHWKDYWNQLQA